MTTTLLSEETPVTPSERELHFLGDLVNWCARCVLNWRWTIQQGLPLFRREMLVQSYRPRTYVIRVGFAITLFFVALIYTALKTGTDLFSTAGRLPGQGRVILDSLVWMLFVFIYVFAPAVTGGVITLEKERQTLVLLYLTKLTPWHVVLEKFLSRLVPTLTILLLAVPLLVFSYAFGGVSPEMLITSIWFLFVTAVQVTAVAVLSSTLSRHTTFAFVLTYLALALLYFGPALADIWILDGHFTNQYLSRNHVLNNYAAPIAPSATAIATGTAPGPSPLQPLAAIPPDMMLLACFPLLLYGVHYAPSVVGAVEWKPMILAGCPSLLSALVCLALARCFVYYRAFEDQRLPLLTRMKNFAKWLRVPRRATVPLTTARAHDVPGNAPITWRETYRGSSNWLPALLMLEIPTGVLVLWLARMGNGSSEQISLVIMMLWLLAVLLICVHTSSLMTKERGQQTLELLLTTPMSSREIIQQKFNSTQRLMLICAAPLLTTILFQTWWRTVLVRPNFGPDPKIGFIWWEYLITAASCVILYLQLVGWVALWAGLRNKNPTRATLDALGGVAFCCIVPAIVMGLPISLMIPMDLALGLNLVRLLAAQLSPMAMVGLAEFTNLREVCYVPLLPSIVNTLVYGVLLHYARKYVLDRADYFLGRTVYY